MITYEHLKNGLNLIKKNDPDKDSDFCKLELSVELLRVLVDNEWTNQALFPNHHPYLEKKTKKAVDYLGSENIGYSWQENVVKLAQMLYNLQNIQNFGKIIEEIKQGNLTSRFAELEFAEFLYKSGISFLFVNPTGRKRENFDIKILDNEKINCEVKQIESTILTESTIRNILDHASSQLPKNEGCIIMIRIPEKFIRDNKFKNILDNVIKDFFKRKSKILGIFISYRLTDENHSGKFVYKKYLIRNPESKFKSKSNDIVLDSLDKSPEGDNWLNLRKFVEEELKNFT